MPTKTNVEIVEGRGAAEASVTDGFEDISDGIEARMNTQSGDVSAATVYVETEGAMTLTVELSPNNGERWYEPLSESPVEFAQADTDAIHVEYNASHVRLTASDATGVRADIRVVA